MNTFPRWLRFALVLAVGGILAAGGWFYRVQQTQTRQSAEAQLQAVARLKVKEIADWRANQLGEGRELAASGFFGQGVARWLAEPQAAQLEPIRTRFRSLRERYRYRDIVLLDSAGQPRMSLSGRLDPLEAEDARCLASALRERQPVLTELHSNANRNAHLATIVPIYSSSEPTAEAVGAVVLEHDVEQFLYPLIQTWPTPSRTAETLLVRRDGDSVLFLNELRHQTNTALKLRIPLTKSDMPAVMAVWGRTGVVEGRDYRGVPVVSVLEAVPDSPWFMVSKMDADEVFAHWRSRAALILGVILGLMGFALAAVVGVWQRSLKAQFHALYRAEAARAQTESRHRVTLQSIGDAVIVTDAEGRVEMLNPVAETLTGWRQEEARGEPLNEVFRIISEDNREPGESPAARVLREGTVVGLANHTLLLARDGTERPIADSGAPIRGEAGRITGVVLVFRDQSEERRAQRALQASEERHRLLIEHLHAGVVVHAPDTHIRLANRQASALLGLTVDQMTGKTAMDPAWCFVREDETPMPLEEYPVNRVLRTQEPLENQVVGVKRSRTGDRVWVLVNAFPEFDAGGALRQVVVTFVDITDRKQHEREIERLTRLYATLSQINQAIVRIQSHAELAREVARVAVEFGGFKLAWVGRHNEQTREVTPLGSAGDPQEFVHGFRHSSAESAESCCLCARAIRENRCCVANDLSAVPGMNAWLSALGPGSIRAAAVFPIRVRGAVWGVLGVYAGEAGVFQDKEVALLEEAAMDIGYAVEHLENEAQRKQAETALRRSETMLLQAQEIGKVGAWEWDLNEQTMYWTTETYRVHDFEPSAVAPDPQAHITRSIECYPPEERSRVMAAFQRCVNHGEPYELECPFTSTQGRRMWVRTAGRAIREDGRIVKVVGDIQDVTERKRAEAALRESEQRLQMALEAAGMVSWELDVATRQLRYSSNLPAMAGSPEVAPYLSLNSFIQQTHLDDRAGVERAIAETIQDGVPFDCEYRVRLPNGDWHWLAGKGRRTDAQVGKTAKVMGVSQDITARKQAEAALRESEARFRSLVEGAPEAVFVQCGGVFRYVNAAMLSLVGAAREGDLLGQSFADRIAPEYQAAIRDRVRAQREDGAVAPPMEQEYLRLDGTRVPVETTAVAIRFGGQDGHLVFVRNMVARREAEKERAKLEAQLLQAQKMESVGRLAGGVAHDFNNLLMSIVGYAELCRDRIEPTHPIREYLDEITHDAERSSDITRQLLAFARKQTIAPRVLDLNDAVAGMLKLLRRLIGEDINLAWRPGAGLRPVKLDPSQVDQILANLCVNSRDAIAGVGEITLETGRITIDADYCARHPEANPGAYVFLTVSDNGCGMDKETLAQVFEPFFTTKGLGKGTGLGLATVYGIVKQNNGFIYAYSEAGKGTTFKIYLPEIAGETAAIAVASKTKAPRGRGETILLVEDEKSLRVTCGLFLEALGYKVLAAETPGEALKMAAKHAGDLHVLLTDVVMPGMDGQQLANRIRAVKPGVKVLFMSGYTADVIAQRGVLDEGVQFLSKPFTRDDLARKMREMLEAD